MNKIYFAKLKSTNELYVGMKGQTGFSKLSDLRRSITYKHQYYRSNKTKDDYNFYCVDSNEMKIEQI